jgi:hypothetical protein
VFGYTSVSCRQDGLQLATILAVALAILTPAQAMLGGVLPERAALSSAPPASSSGSRSQGLQAIERRRQAGSWRASRSRPPSRCRR